MYRAIDSGPASTGSKPTSRTSVAATCFSASPSPQYTKVRRLALLFASNTLNSTSLGTVPNADTTAALGIFFASSSAPEEVRPTTRPVSFAFIGSEPGDDHLARHIAGLFQHVVDSRPVDG